jgi:hypothetical protein
MYDGAMNNKGAKSTTTRKQAGQAFYLNAFAHPHFTMERTAEGWRATSKIGRTLVAVLADGAERPTILQDVHGNPIR